MQVMLVLVLASAPMAVAATPHALRRVRGWALKPRGRARERIYDRLERYAD